MQMNGWGTAYINIPQAAGLATERLSAHVGQRIRWARGMIQILRTDNPLFAPGLTFPQRLCYFNAMCHFLYAVPRLIFLTAPLIYLLLNHTNIPGYWAAILAYALPHLTLSNVTNSRIQGEHRHSFWNEIYETVLSPYILLPTMMALINPKLGKFNVTAKGGVVKRTFFDTKIAQPFLVMLLFNIAGLLVAIPRFFIWDRDRPGTVMMNVIWCCLQRRHSGRMHGGRARAEAVADHGAHQRGNPRGGQNAGRKIDRRRDNQHVQRRHQHPPQRGGGACAAD